MNLQLNFPRNRKGIGTVFGMVFFLLIVMLVFASLTIVLNQNTSLEQTVIQTRQMDNDRANEQLIITNSSLPTFQASGATLIVNCLISNTGTIPVQIVRLWAEDMSPTTPVYASSPVSGTIGTLTPGQTNDTFAGSVTFQTTVQNNDNFRFWFETSRGNQFSIKISGGGSVFYVNQTTPGILASPTQIGAILLSWKDFNYYDLKTGSLPSGDLGLAGFGHYYAYTVPLSTCTLMNVTLTNLDTEKRDITLTGDSFLYGVQAKNGNGNTAYQGDIVSVTGTDATGYTYSHAPFTTQILLYNQSVNVFFIAAPPSKISDGDVLPFNLVLFGYISQTGAAYGQNIPFVSLQFASSVTSSNSFVVSGFTNPTTAGVPGSVTVSARNALGNTVTSYTGTVHFTSSDGLAIAGSGLPVDYHFVVGDNGVHTFTNGITLKTVGIQSITATDTVTDVTGTETSITINPASAVSFVVSGFQSPTTAGVAGSVTVIAKDAFGNVATNYLGTVHFTSSDSMAVLSPDSKLSSGVGTFTITLKTAGIQSITAIDTVTGTITGIQTGITVNPASAVSFVVSGFQSPTTAGVAGSVTVIAKDVFGNVATGYLGIVHFSSSDPFAIAGSGLPVNYQFVAGDNGQHTFTKGVTLSDAGTQSIVATDTVSGTITGSQNGITVNPALVAPAVTASPVTVDQGQSSGLSSSSILTGTSPFTYQWLQKAPGASSYAVISGAISTSYTFVTSGSTTTGVWNFELQVTDTVGAQVTSSATPVTVNVAPTVTGSPASWIMDIGQSKTFSATAAGGSGSYVSYQWYVGGAVQFGQTAQTFSYSPASSGSYSVTVTVTDNLGATSAQSSAASVSVAASPTVSIAPVGPLTMDVGQVQAFTATRSGGSGTIHYQWYLDSITVGTDSSSYSYTASGTSHSVTCMVTDSASIPIASPLSNSVSITVNVALTVSVTPISYTMDVGQSLTFTATASGGSGSLSYQWYLGGSAVSGLTGTTYTYVPASVGSPTIYCRVTDQVTTTPFIVQSNTPSVSVAASPTVSIALSGSFTMDVGQTKTFTATPSGGSGTLSYQWYVDSNPVGSNSATYSYAAALGSHSVTCTVTDSASVAVTSPASNAVTISVAASPTVSIAPFWFVYYGCWSN